uniref:Secreted protein n=1 Tax=Anguilla anguilla TaxID=7936 RepID=A0A0E9WS91_ANGAN
MNWYADCEPGLTPNISALLMLLWLNGSESPQPCSKIYCVFPGEWRLLQQQKGGLPHGFEMRCSTSMLGAMFRCPHFGNVVYHL